MEDLSEIKNPELEMLKANKESGYNYRQRRHEEWDDNYELYRGRVKINRLTQRQSVNLPLMKLVIKTLLKDVDDMPVLFLENLDNDKDAEVFKNEYWRWTVDQNNLEIFDVVDKKQVGLFGRTFDQWQVVDGKVKVTLQDPMDILVSRYTDPIDIHSSRFLVHTHIFEPLSVLEKNPEYDQQAIADLKLWYATEQGLIKAQHNVDLYEEKMRKMADLGLLDPDHPVLGETYVEKTLHFVFRQEPGDSKEQIYLYVEVEDQQILMKKKLEEVIGVTRDHYFRNHYPYVSWADDVERQDFWSDGISDVARVPCKVLNSWFSQLVENRTLRNFGMQYFNSSIDGFVPQSFQPVPWGWYGIPVPEGKNLSDVFQKVDIPDLSESLDEMQFVIGLMEKATGATSTLQGAETEKKITLGEIQLMFAEAKERVKGMSKFYTKAWEDRGTMFIKLLEAAEDKLDAVRIEKKGRNSDNLYSREIRPQDWRSQSGYRCRVWNRDEKDTNDINVIQKQNAVKTSMPDNPKVAEIYQRKLLEWAGYTPDEITEIMKIEEDKRQAMMSEIGQALGTPMPGQMPAVGGAVQPKPQPQSQLTAPTLQA